jgi:predicted component of type VI protein secretion system
MDQQTDNHYMTREFLENKIVQLTDEIALMTKFRENLITSSNATHDTLTRTQDSLKHWTRQQLSDSLITQEQALELAQIGDFTLTTCYDVTMLVEHTFTIELEAGDDIDDVLSTIDFSADSYHTELMNSDYSVSETNYDECD